MHPIDWLVRYLRALDLACRPGAISPQISTRTVRPNLVAIKPWVKVAETSQFCEKAQPIRLGRATVLSQSTSFSDAEILRTGFSSLHIVKILGDRGGGRHPASADDAIPFEGGGRWPSWRSSLSLALRTKFAGRKVGKSRYSAGTMRCPECKSVNFVRARFLWWEPVLLLMLSRPFRCEGCLGRMYGFLWTKSRPRDNKNKKNAVKPTARVQQTTAPAVAPQLTPVVARSRQSSASVSNKPPLPL